MTLAAQDDLAGVGRLGARQDLDQRRLAGPVLSGEGVDAAPPDGEVHALERLNARIVLRDTGDAQFVRSIDKVAAHSARSWSRHGQPSLHLDCPEHP